MFIQHFEVKEYIMPAYSERKSSQIILDGGCGEFPKIFKRNSRVFDKKSILEIRKVQK